MLQPIVNTLPEHSTFAGRHLGSDAAEVAEMLRRMGLESLDHLIDQVVPARIRLRRRLDLPEALSESSALASLYERARQNRVLRSLIGRGYHNSLLPTVIQRNVLENPGWYTAYTPYQAEIAQGRLEALINYQTVICELTGLPVANASLLDEATASAEAMTIAAAARPEGKVFAVGDGCLPQTIDVLRTRAEPVGIEIRSVDLHTEDFREVDGLIGVLCPYPAQDGAITELGPLIDRIHQAGGLAVVAADLLALTLLQSPGECGADIAVGSAQRFGVPLGYGGPHAAYLACTENHKRKLPGRLVGVSRDADGRPAYRLALQTREQHIRREKATSNICTAQVLLAVIAGFYAVYHGRAGLRHIANRVARATRSLADSLGSAGFAPVTDAFFDTITIPADAEQVRRFTQRAEEEGLLLRTDRPGYLGISLDEAAVESGDWKRLGRVFGLGELREGEATGVPSGLLRSDAYLDQPVFHRYRTETRMLRYLRQLEGKDVALNQSMIPLGSCTMKLNSTSEMIPIGWPEFAALHPFAPREHAAGYTRMARELEQWLAEITGFAAVSLQPNAGSQGELAGLLAIRRYHLSRGEPERNICLIPTSAHGTNPASAVMAGMKVAPVKCDEEGNIDLDDVTEKAVRFGNQVAALMITYPSTHGVFEESIDSICEIVHRHGGQVYMDGANLNAQVGLCRPADIGADVCHLNLHKTFCIPHGGGGPGVGPIGVAAHLSPFLPGHRDLDGDPTGAVSAGPLGSAGILPISWMYIAMMGPDGLAEASRRAILNANYIAHRLGDHFPVLYRGSSGFVAHECIIDVRGFRESAGIEVEDVAKRLMDFGFHAPTMSWPVPGTLMIEPTESEDLEEIDRFCDAMIAIHREIQAIEEGSLDAEDNPLKQAPHPAENAVANEWKHAYSRETAVYPAEWVRDRKFWPPVSRIDNVYGDRNLFCTCDGMKNFAE